MADAKRAIDLRPTPELIEDLVEMAVDEFQERDKRDEVRDMAFRQENPIEHPAHVDFQPVHMGVIPEVVQRVNGILNDYPVVQVTTTSLATLQQKRTTKVEDFLNTVFPAMEQDSDSEVWDLVKQDVIRYGRGCDLLEHLP